MSRYAKVHEHAGNRRNLYMQSKRCLMVLVFVMGLHNIALAASWDYPCEAVKCGPGSYFSSSDNKCKKCTEVKDTELQSVGVTKDMLWCPGYMSDCNDKKNGLHTCESYIRNYDDNYEWFLENNNTDEGWKEFTTEVAWSPTVQQNQEREDYRDEVVGVKYVADALNDYKKCKLTEVHCKPGYYLPKNTDKCEFCSNEFRKYCPGGWYEVEQSKDQGVYDCDASKITGRYHTACVSCPDGMRANSNEDKFIWYDVMINGSKADSSDRALRNIACINNNGYGKYYKVECGNELSSDPDYNKKNGIWGLCEEEIGVASLPIQKQHIEMDRVYLNDNSIVGIEMKTFLGSVYYNGTYVKCADYPEFAKVAKEARMYCPGNWVTKDANGNYPTPLQQMKQCPPKKEPNDDLSGCECMWKDKGATETPEGECIHKELKLGYKDLYYGPFCKDDPTCPLFKQCWTKFNNKAAYRKCMGFD